MFQEDVTENESDVFIDRFKINVVTPHFLVQRCAVDSQGACRLLAIPAIGFKRLNDQLAFRLCQCYLQGRTTE